MEYIDDSLEVITKQKRMQQLVSYLNECTVEYDAGHSVISDREWDDLYFELVQLENTLKIVLPESPTHNIHFQTVSELKKVTHNHLMLSLEKTKDLDVIKSFCNNRNVIAMCKMDGLTCSLTYKDGRLVAAETRGNGVVGEDILHNAYVLPSIPKVISYKEDLVIDGEIISTQHNFENFASTYKNPRNFAAGSIRLLDSKECAARGLTFVAWEVKQGFSEINSVANKLNQLHTEHFTIVPYIVYGDTGSNLEIIVTHLTNSATQLGYPIDGCVFKFEDIAYGESLGSTSHHFKNAMAYKFYDETYTTHLLNVEWTMGRTGVLTPVAIFEPLDIDGSTVERASVHNISVMKNLFHGLPFKGQKIEVFKANMIIPQIDSAEEPFISDAVSFIDIPEVCPLCGGKVEQITEIDSTVLQCTNPVCSGKLINILDHFCGKKGMDIKGLSKMTLEKLINWNWLNGPSDLFTLAQHREEWVNKPGFGAKSVDKILDAIEFSRQNCELTQFIAALGIPLIGSSASKDLTKIFSTWEAFYNALQEKYPFYEIQGFGYEMHSALYNYNYDEAQYIADNFIIFNSITTAPTESNNTQSLEGMTFVITGKLNHFKNRDALIARIESLGGKVTGSVSKNTTYLVNNDAESTSSKNKTAKSLGIPILSENDLLQTFGIE